VPTPGQSEPGRARLARLSGRRPRTPAPSAPAEVSVRPLTCVERRGAHKSIVPRDSRQRFAHLTGGFKPGCGIPLLRGTNDGNRLRCEGPRLRWPAVLLLLALRAREWPIDAPRGIRGSGGLGQGEGGSPAAHGRIPPEGRAGVRPATGPDRAAHRRGAYLH